MSDVEIMFADHATVPALKELWMEAFGDEREYVDFYFANRFTDENMLVLKVDGSVASMMGLLPVWLHCGNTRMCARYIYAVATKMEYRRMGYAEMLLKKGYERIREPFLLEPADENLMEYYGKRGFEHAFSIQEYEMKERGSGQETEYCLLTLTPNAYKQMRDQRFRACGYAEWDRDAVAYALLENDFCGGYAYKVVHNDTEDFLVFRMEEGTLRIIETTLDDADILGVIRKLRLKPERVYVRRPAKTGGKNFAMIYGNHEIKNGYLNLTLD